MAFLQTFLVLALELTLLFIGISFIINLIQGYIPTHKIEQLLNGRNRFVGGSFAILFAFITPFCSCSTIPVIVNMLKKKLNFGIVMVFLFASPLLDPTIITIMAVILGWKVALIYTVVTVIFSFIIGFTLEALGLENQTKNVMIEGVEGLQENQKGLRYAWNETVDLMKKVLVYIIIGAGIGAAIKGYIPQEWIASTFSADRWWLIPIAAVIGVPLYIRLASMIPISNILILKGMALGPVMAMLISSAGASLPEVVMLNAIFKKKLVAIFILSVITMASFSGLVFYLI